MGESSDIIASRASGVLYEGKNDEGKEDLYVGFSFSYYYHLNQKYINPYFGLGGFLGITFNCSDKEREEGCIEDLAALAYPEIGVSIKLGKLHIYPFVRRYDFGDENTYGLNLGLKF